MTDSENSELKEEKRFLKKIGAILDEPHPFNQIKDKKKSNIEKIFIKKKSN